MDWFRSQDWREIIVVGVVQGVIGILLLAAVNELVANSLVRDIGVVVIVLSVIIVGGYTMVKSCSTNRLARRRRAMMLPGPRAHP